jgi:hypothetical protein
MGSRLCTNPQKKNKLVTSIKGNSTPFTGVAVDVFLGSNTGASAIQLFFKMDNGFEFAALQQSLFNQSTTELF